MASLIGRLVSWREGLEVLHREFGACSKRPYCSMQWVRLLLLRAFEMGRPGAERVFEC